MAKTEETRMLEQALDDRCRKRREYGCTEVTIGFKGTGKGDEIADFMSIDSKDVIRCYEIKVSLQDLRSEAKKSWYGDYNYLVVSEGLYMQSPPWGNYIPPYAGIMAGSSLKIMRQAKKRPVSDADRNMLKDSLIRTLYWKMDGFRNASDMKAQKELQAELSSLQEEFETYRQAHDRAVWTAQDLEYYYRKNHQTEDFSLEQFAKQQRKEYAQRTKKQLVWKDGSCPVCGRKAAGGILTDYCPFCGSDLRDIIP